jgi:signal transduction histidine kinase/DNA-binding response OmpR family regulator
MAKHVGWAFPNADQDWPFVWLPSYWDIMEEVLPTSIWSGVNLAPIVQPEQAAAFEDYAYTKFSDTFGENTTMGAMSHFGRGIWVKDEERVHTVDNRYHDTTGVPIYHGSPYNYMAPKLQDGLVHTPYTMMNVHGFELQGLALDAVMNCSIARKQDHANYVDIHGEDDEETLLYNKPKGCSDSDGKACAPNSKQSRCSALSGMLPPKNIKDEHGIAGFVATPIYPANDPYELVGYIFGIVYWIEVMIDIFPKDTIGINCVFGDPKHQYTYALDGTGTSTLICDEDCHDAKYDDLRMTTTIIDPNLLSDGSVTYEMTCYPNDDFFRTYRTKNPSLAAIGAVGIILFTSALFFLYDYYVRREFRSKKDLFEAKRKFVRFVSHEVRTPMNSVCMGLSVLQEEAAMALGMNQNKKGNKDKQNHQKYHQTQQQKQQQQDQQQDKQIDVAHWFDLANEISSNAQASVDVLDDFLNYDKIATGEMVLEYTAIPIWNLIADTIAEFNLPMTKKKLTLHNSLPNLAVECAHNRSGLFYSDETIQKSNKRYINSLDDDTSNGNSNSNSNNDGGLSDMEAGCKSDLLEAAQKQKLVGDSVRIKQVIRNLLSNAIKFSKEGGDITISTTFMKCSVDVGGDRGWRIKAQPPKVEKKTFELKSKEVVTCEKTGEIAFTIKDSGAGLSKTQLKNLFGAGVQFNVNELQSGKGSGLGLYIAKGIVEQHGGSLVADSEGNGLGCTFTVRLPIYNPPEEEWGDSQPFSWKRRRPRKRSSFEKAVRKHTVMECDDEEEGGDMDCTLHSLDSRDDGMSDLKILLVDDSKSNRKLLDRLMTMRGHRCEQADDGHKGLDMTMRAESFGQPYDLIFMDYEMPTMNGPEAVKQIRGQGSDVYIIGLTGNIMADDVKYFHVCGANAVFPKPFKVKEFEQLLEEGLSRDTRGRIIEKPSTAFELSTMGFLEEDAEVDLELSLGDIDFDDTGISSIASFDDCDNDNTTEGGKKSPSSTSPLAIIDRNELDYQAAKRALRGACF